VSCHGSFACDFGSSSCPGRGFACILVDDDLLKAGVCALDRHLTSRLGIGLDEVANVPVLVRGQVAESEPVGRWDQVEVMLGDVAHEQQLALEEGAVHLIGLDGQQATEAVHGLGMEPFTCIGPREGMGETLVPGVDEGQQLVA